MKITLVQNKILKKVELLIWYNIKKTNLIKQKRSSTNEILYQFIFLVFDLKYLSCELKLVEISEISV